MKKTISFLLLTIGLCSLLYLSCKKDDTETIDCFPNVTRYTQIIDKPATVDQSGGIFYLIEQGTIDTRLKPCNLPVDFQVDNLQVIISGKSYGTTQSAGAPCCTEDFVITKIRR